MNKHGKLTENQSLDTALAVMLRCAVFQLLWMTQNSVSTVKSKAVYRECLARPVEARFYN